MEDPTAHGEPNSRSASERSTLDTDQTKRTSGSTASSTSKHNHEESTTPTTNPPSASQQTFAMGPPRKPDLKATPTSAQQSQPITQTSSQGISKEQTATSTEAIRNGDRPSAVSSKHQANNTVHTTPRKRSHVEVDQQQSADDQDTSDEDSEPANRIAAFDWMELQTRYHQQLEQFDTQEQALYHSFNELCNVIHPYSSCIRQPNNYSTSTSGRRVDITMKWIEASNGITRLQVPTIVNILTFYQHENANHARAT